MSMMAAGAATGGSRALTLGSGVSNQVVTWSVCDNFNCLINWADHWQTLLSGIIATVAAGISIYFLHKQILIAEKQEQLRRARRLAASRARLPMFLSDTTSYAREALVLLRLVIVATRPGGNLDRVLALPRPSVPDQAILSFEALVEATDDDKFSGLISNLIGEIQVLNSRLRSMGNDTQAVLGVNAPSFVLNAAKVHAYASSMFEYARREVEQPPHELDWDEIGLALSLNGLYESQFPELWGFIERARQRAEDSGMLEEIG